MTRRYLLFLLAPLAVGCGGASDTPPSAPPTPKIDPTKPTSLIIVSGDGQTARIKTSLPSVPVLEVLNGNGSPVGGVQVTFSVSAGAGSIASATATSGTDGKLNMPTWTMGSTPGGNSVTASVAGVSPVTISATARPPLWTVMVYLAGDNTLAAFGAVNLQQMADAGVNPEVQVVVQAEFSPKYFQQYGLTPATINRPNYNTFRYVMDGSVARSPSTVLVGPATDIGNVDMTDPAQLRSFVQWAEQAAPSQHTILVLWNHGGDANGLIEDETSAPGNFMSLSQLRNALFGLPAFDIIDFEMCLMGGYETLETVRGLTRAVVASEEEEVVNGWDFSRFLQAVYSDPGANATSVATKLADAFDAAYAGTNYPETIAAYDLNALPAVDAAVAQLGNSLSAAMKTGLSSMSQTLAQSQRYGDPTVTDLVDAVDSLATHTNDAGVAAARAAVRAAVLSSSFLLTTHIRNSTDYGARNLARSRGLQIVLPAGPTTPLPLIGPGSLSAYQQLFPGTAWNAFLQQWAPAVLASRAVSDVGANRLAVATLWDTSFVSRGAVTTLLIEPDGNIYGPLLGTLSASGDFSADALSAKTYFEAWYSHRFVETGKYYFIAWLISDPTNYQPLVNVAYQVGSAAVQSLYGPGTYPRLSLQRSILNDPAPTAARLLGNFYTDMQVIATWTVGSSGAANMISSEPSGLGASIPRLAENLIQLRHAMNTSTPMANSLSQSGITKLPLFSDNRLKTFLPRSP